MKHSKGQSNIKLGRHHKKYLLSLIKEQFLILIVFNSDVKTISIFGPDMYFYRPFEHSNNINYAVLTVVKKR